ASLDPAAVASSLGRPGPSALTARTSNVHAEVLHGARNLVSTPPAGVHDPKLTPWSVDVRNSYRVSARPPSLTGALQERSTVFSAVALGAATTDCGGSGAFAPCPLPVIVTVPLGSATDAPVALRIDSVNCAEPGGRRDVVGILITAVAVV